MSIRTIRSVITGGVALLTGAFLAQAAAPSTPQGVISAHVYHNISGTAVANLTGNPKFPDSPDEVMYPSYFELWATGDIATPPDNGGDNYGAQMAGYFYPPTTGNYVFYICSDDESELYLSPDDNPDNKVLIAIEPDYNGPRAYLVGDRRDPLYPENCSITYTNTAWPTRDLIYGGAQITLQAGQAYYIEALQKEGTGGDNLSVAVEDPNFSIDYTLPIPGQYLSSVKATAPTSIAVQPEDQTAEERGSATFRVTADGTPPYTYQWRKNNVAIQDATNMTYTVTGVTMADNDAQFTVVVTGGQGSVTSDPATLTIIPDVTAPELLSAKPSPNQTQVTLSFSEPMDPATATDRANYAISSAGGSLTLSGATLSAGGDQVTLTTSQQTLGTKYTVVVNNVQDAAGTPNTIAPDSSTIFVPVGELQEIGGFIVFEAENYDRNLDGLWLEDTVRQPASGGVSMTVPNGTSGDSEDTTKLEYDITFAQTATYQIWYLAGADSGSDDSGWFHLDGARPAERVDGNQASMTGFNGAIFEWNSDAQDAPDPFRVAITAGPHVFALAVREDGAFFDKFIFTTDTSFVPTGFGPPETREGSPARPTVSMTAPSEGGLYPVGSDITVSADASGDTAVGINIVRVEFTASGNVIGEATESPYSITWQDVPKGIYALQATATDELGATAVSSSVVIEVGADSPYSANIAWVSFHSADDTPSAASAAAGFTEAPDAPYTALLRDAGHQVTRVVTSANPDAGLLNLFDLVITSRSVPSADYQNAGATAWNGITAPIMVLGGYPLRSSRMGFTTGTTMVDTTGTIALTVNDPSHPIFEGIALDGANTMVNPYADVVDFDGAVQRGVSVNNDPVVTGGNILATVATAADPTVGGMVIGEYQAGTVMGNGTADTLAGHRLVFLTGSREASGLTSEGAGIYDLHPDGAAMFLNAVYYMSGTEPAPDRPTLTLNRSASGIEIEFTGTLQSVDSVTGTWADVPGATSPYTVTTSESQQFYRAAQ